MYLRGKFLADLASSLPWELMFARHKGFNDPIDDSAKQSTQTLILSGLGMLRLIRLHRLATLFTKVERDVRFNYVLIRVVKFVMCIFFVGHWAACYFFFLSTRYVATDTWIGETGDAGILELYVTSLYWSITTYTTVGYGDIHAVNELEKISSAIYMVFNMGVMAYILGNIALLVTGGDQRTAEYREQLFWLDGFFFRNNVPNDLRAELVGYLKLQHDTFDERKDVLAAYPAAIRTRALRHLYGSIFKRAYTLKNCGESFIDNLIINATLEVYMPGIFLLHELEFGKELFILVSGTVELYSTTDGAHVKVGERTHAGDVFGEIAFICSFLQPYSAKAITVTRALLIKKEAYSAVASLFVQDANILLKNLMGRLESKQDAWHRELYARVRASDKRRAAERADRLCAAVTENDLDAIDDIVGEEGGAQAELLGQNGRYPLHLAAAKGSLGAAVRLLDLGADPNLLDPNGVSPVYEAVRSDHIAVADVLTASGATLQLANPGVQLCTAISNNRADLVDRLLTYGADCNEMDYHGRRALHVAASLGLVKIIKLLLENGASVEATDDWGRTALDEAERAGHEDALRMLRVHVDRRRRLEREKSGGTSLSEEEERSLYGDEIKEPIYAS
eukprot:jgi/Mesvir1/21130/Mv08885-RA.1